MGKIERFLIWLERIFRRRQLAELTPFQRVLAVSIKKERL